MATKFFNGIDLQSQKIVSLADGSAANDAATFGQLQNYVNGLAFKEEVRVATTANGTLASAFQNAATVDGITLATGDRILVKNQTTQTENGIYTVNVSGAPTRALDADSATDLIQATVRVRLGTTNSGTQWTQSTDSPTIGSSNIVFAASGGGSVYTAGAGLSLTTGTFAVVAGAGIIADGTSTRIDPAYAGLAKRYSANIGNGALTSIAVAHNLGTRDITWSLYVIADNTFVLTDAVATDTNTLTLTFATAPASNALRVTVHA
jgi:hypothetical protein